jgi:hypothetical protein
LAQFTASYAWSVDLDTCDIQTAHVATTKLW